MFILSFPFIIPIFKESIIFSAFSIDAPFPQEFRKKYAFTIYVKGRFFAGKR